MVPSRRAHSHPLPSAVARKLTATTRDTLMARGIILVQLLLRQHQALDRSHTNAGFILALLGRLLEFLIRDLEIQQTDLMSMLAHLINYKLHIQDLFLGLLAEL